MTNRAILKSRHVNTVFPAHDLPVGSRCEKNEPATPGLSSKPTAKMFEPRQTLATGFKEGRKKPKA